MPSNVKLETLVAMKPASMVTTTERSAGDPVVNCRHTTDDCADQEVVSQLPRAMATEAVGSTALKFKPDTLMIVAVENTWFVWRASLTTGAVWKDASCPGR